MQVSRLLCCFNKFELGKTTTTENILYASGFTKEVGRVDDGNTVMDFLPQERERGITISSAAIAISWKDHSINIIDTPGHVDFTVEVERSVRVLDSAVVVIDAVAGVQAQTRTVWKLAQKNLLPALVFTNKMDRDGASMSRAVDSLRNKLGMNGVPIQYPLIRDDIFVGLVDLTTLNLISWDARTSSSKAPLPPSVDLISEDHPFYAEIQQARVDMLETIADTDEEFMTAYLNDSTEITPSLIRKALRRGCLDRKLVPVLCGASLKGKGIEPLLDSIVEYLPSPYDKVADKAVNKETGEEILVAPGNQELFALAFKVIFDRARGPLVFVRVYSGSLQSRKPLFNTSKQKKDIPNQVLHINADDLSQSTSIEAGNIGCIVGLKNTATGDTLVAASSSWKNFSLSGLTIPQNVFSVSIEPDKSSQQTDLVKALSILALEDPSLMYEVSEESGQTIIRGLGELHLDIVCDKLRRQFNIDVHIGKAYVAYRESVGVDQRPMTTDFTLDRVIGSNRLYAAITATIRKMDDFSPACVVIEEDLKRRLSPLERDTIMDAFASCLSSGSRGYPLVGVSIQISSFLKDHDTTEGAIRACIVSYVQSMLKGLDLVVLEPVMSLEIECSEPSVGNILSDLSVKRRAEIKEVISLPGEISSISGLVPLETMLGYATELRSMTHGQGTFSMEYFSHQIVDASLLHK
jgi:elongation factor G